MRRYPLMCLGILLRLRFAISEGLPDRRLQASNYRIPIQTQEYEEQRAFVLSLKINNRIYNQSLEDDTSDDYMKLADDVRNLLQQVYGCVTCATYQTYKGATDITFSNGSVIADSTLVFSSVFPINGDIVKNLFCNEIQTAPLKTNISVDPTFTYNLPAPVTVPVPLITTPQPTTTSLSVPTTYQSLPSTAQYYSDISSSTDGDLSKTTSPSHNIPYSTYTSTPDTATTLSSHATDTLNSSPTTSSKINTEFTHSTGHVNAPSNSATTLSESTTDSTDTPTSPLSSHVPISENTTDFSKNTRSPPLTISSHTRGSSKTDSSTFWTVNPNHNATAMSWHPSSHTNVPPRVSTNTTSHRNHSHIIILSTTKPKNGSAASSSSYDGVPGWGIALLVLVSVILLLLLIFFILALWHWCCPREETGLVNVTGSPKPYDREPSAPEFLPMDPYRKIYPEDFDKPKKNRTGMYVVNP